MILDPVQIIEEQITNLQQEIDVINVTIESNARKAITFLFLERALAESQIQQNPDLQKDRLELEHQINRLSVSRKTATRYIEALSILKERLSTPECQEWINTYITNKILNTQIDIRNN